MRGCGEARRIAALCPRRARLERGGVVVAAQVARRPRRGDEEVNGGARAPGRAAPGRRRAASGREARPGEGSGRRPRAHPLLGACRAAAITRDCLARCTPRLADCWTRSARAPRSLRDRWAPSHQRLSTSIMVPTRMSSRRVSTPTVSCSDPDAAESQEQERPWRWRRISVESAEAACGGGVTGMGSRLEQLSSCGSSARRSALGRASLSSTVPCGLPPDRFCSRLGPLSVTQGALSHPTATVACGGVSSRTQCVSARSSAAYSSYVLAAPI